MKPRMTYISCPACSKVHYIEWTQMHYRYISLWNKFFYKYYEGVIMSDKGACQGIKLFDRCPRFYLYI